MIKRLKRPINQFQYVDHIWISYLFKLDNWRNLSVAWILFDIKELMLIEKYAN